MAELKLRKETNGVYNSMLLTRQLIQSISDQVRISGKVVAISPDTLFLKFERIKTRRLPVKPHVSFSLAPQVMLYDSMACVPDSIDVKGPAAILDTLGYISTRHIQAGEITRNNTLTADLVYPVKHIPLIFSSTQVKINIFAEKFTETSVEVPVAPDTSGNCKIRTFPEKCIITVMVPLREFKNIDQTQFKLTVSCHEAATATGSNLQVRVGSLPRHTRLVRIEPQNVEFIILD
jgi:YbbR domain-containing protein